MEATLFQYAECRYGVFGRVVPTYGRRRVEARRSLRGMGGKLKGST